MKKTIIVIAALLISAMTAAGIMVLDLVRYAEKPISTESDEIIINIPAKKGFKTILGLLEEEELVRSPFRFKLIAVYKGYDKRIKAGEYLLSMNMSPLEILEKLVSGKEMLYRVTIPEGYTMVQISEVLEQNGWPVQEKFLALARDQLFVESLGINAASLEGYLFPETYHFSRNIEPEKMILDMVNRFRSVFAPDLEKRADELGFTVHEIVTLASIIEKETGVPYERPTVSSVFHNRLKKNMRLESDPTVIYGVEDFDGKITRRHLTTVTLYNTYRIRGLPPGPIASPGKASLEAALYPSETDYLFFVSKKDQTHFFSTNYADHKKAVQKYQLSR